MKSKFWITPIIAGSMILTSVATPMAAAAATPLQSGHHKQQQKNQWRNLGIAGGVLAGLGLITHNGTLTLLGIGGGLYSAYRYEQDRKGQSKAQHQRAALYSHTKVHYKGHNYKRVTVWKNGHKYYKFQQVG